MNTRQVQYALELSNQLNFSQAASRLGISQPALSKQIHALEEELGVKLFDRSTTPLTLTAAGEHFVREAELLLYRETHLIHSMQKFCDGKHKKLTIGISPFRALYLMPRVLKRLSEQYPDVQVCLHEEGSDTLRREAAEGKYDLCILNLPVDEARLDVVPLEPDTLVLAVPNRLLGQLDKAAQTAKTLELSACQNLDFILLSQAQEMRRLFEDACKKAGLLPKIKLEVVGMNTAWAMCRAGLGATLLPLQFIREVGGADEVRIFFPADASRDRQPVVATRRQDALTDEARFALRLLTGQES